MSTAAESALKIIQAKTPEQIATVRELFLEYARSLNFSLCFQSFEQELASLPGDYAPPSGRLLLAQFDSRPAGCVAMRPLEHGICEMKRLYVRRQFRGHNIGRRLSEAIISEAREAGYARMRLDTVAPLMRVAVQLYRELGFYDSRSYRPNPIAGTLQMELHLGAARDS